MWVFASTRRRTSSPSASISALVALPRLSRKLQCFSETWASPMRQSAAARRVDQRPGLVARRVLEGRAAGAAAQRLRFLARAAMRVHLRADRVGIAGRARETRASTTTAPVGHLAVAVGVAELRRAAIRRPRPSAARAAPKPGCPALRGHRRRRSCARSRRPCRECRAGIRGRRCRRRARSRRRGSRSRRRRSAAWFRRAARSSRTACRAARRRPARRRRGRSGWSRGRAP